MVFFESVLTRKHATKHAQLVCCPTHFSDRNETGVKKFVLKILYLEKCAHPETCQIQHAQAAPMFQIKTKWVSKSVPRVCS